jgi:hypothetical protein
MHIIQALYPEYYSVNLVSHLKCIGSGTLLVPKRLYKSWGTLLVPKQLDKST